MWCASVYHLIITECGYIGAAQHIEVSEGRRGKIRYVFIGYGKCKSVIITHIVYIRGETLRKCGQRKKQYKYQ